MNDTIKMLQNHMSIRKYKNKPVDGKIVDTIVQCAQAAPTSSNFQAYTIIEVRDGEKRKALAEIAGGQQWVIEAPLVMLFCADLNRGGKYYENIDKEVLGNTECFTVAVIDTALAMQKAFIAAQSLGLGGVVVGGIRNDVETVAKLFRLPDMVAPLYLLCLGWPDESPGLKPRLPLDEIRKIDFYDDKDQDALIEKYNSVMGEYYKGRNDSKKQTKWTDHCGQMLMAKPRYNVGLFFRQIGLLKK